MFEGGAFKWWKHLIICPSGIWCSYEGRLSTYARKFKMYWLWYVLEEIVWYLNCTVSRTDSRTFEIEIKNCNHCTTVRFYVLFAIGFFRFLIFMYSGLCFITNHTDLVCLDLHLTCQVYKVVNCVSARWDCGTGNPEVILLKKIRWAGQGHFVKLIMKV